MEKQLFLTWLKQKAEKAKYKYLIIKPLWNVSLFSVLSHRISLLKNIFLNKFFILKKSLKKSLKSI